MANAGVVLSSISAIALLLLSATPNHHTIKKNDPNHERLLPRIVQNQPCLPLSAMAQGLVCTPSPSVVSNIAPSERKPGRTSSAFRSASNGSKKGKTTQRYTTGIGRPPTALWSADAVRNPRCIIAGWIILDH